MCLGLYQSGLCMPYVITQAIHASVITHQRVFRQKKTVAVVRTVAKSRKYTMHLQIRLILVKTIKQYSERWFEKILFVSD